MSPKHTCGFCCGGGLVEVFKKQDFTVCMQRLTGCNVYEAKAGIGGNLGKVFLKQQNLNMLNLYIHVLIHMCNTSLIVNFWL